MQDLHILYHCKCKFCKFSEKIDDQPDGVMSDFYRRFPLLRMEGQPDAEKIYLDVVFEVCLGIWQREVREKRKKETEKEEGLFEYLHR